MPADSLPDPATSRILVVHPDRKTQRVLVRVLGATLVPVELLDGAAAAIRVLDAAPAGGPRPILIADHATVIGAEGDALLAAARRGGHVLVLAEGSAVSSTAIGTAHLFSGPLSQLVDELLITVVKLQRDDVFGLEKYVGWAAHVRSIDLADAGERMAVVERMAADVRPGVGDRVASLASLVADELLSNALHDAPVGADGVTPLYPARAPRRLTPAERVQLRYGHDGRYLAIEVTDWIGSLVDTTVVRHVAKSQSRGSDQVEFRTGGAGMGLALAYGCCNHLVFNLEYQRRTEVIGLVDVRLTPAELRYGAKSFNVFVRARGGGSP